MHAILIKAPKETRTQRQGLTALASVPLKPKTKMKTKVKSTMKTRITLAAAIANAGLNEAEAFAKWNANLERERAEAANNQMLFLPQGILWTTEAYVVHFNDLNHLRA